MRVRGNHMNETKYLANPVVSCRDEGEEGALLYNPDIDEAALINRTGRIIWDFISIPRTLDEVVDHISSSPKAPASDQIASDVDMFIKELNPDFISEVMQAGSYGV